jgi:hypothetical protein
MSGAVVDWEDTMEGVQLMIGRSLVKCNGDFVVGLDGVVLEELHSTAFNLMSDDAPSGLQSPSSFR